MKSRILLASLCALSLLTACKKDKAEQPAAEQTEAAPPAAESAEAPQPAPAQTTSADAETAQPAVKEAEPQQAAQAVAPTPQDAALTDYKEWLGKWTGPEGTWAQIEQTAPTDFNVTLKDLDKETTYAAIARNGAIIFSRNGVETISRTDGKGTGMKWLADKKDCIVIKAGSQGYCR